MLGRHYDCSTAFSYVMPAKRLNCLGSFGCSVLPARFAFWVRAANTANTCDELGFSERGVTALG